SHHRLPNGDHRGSASLARLPAPIQSQWCGARDEWVSLRLFEAFVGPGSSDEDWLRRLADKRETGDAWLSQLARDDRQSAPPGPFQKSRLPPLAQAVGWLIVSHHRLPNGDHRGSASLARLPAPIQSQWCGARD
ncbi:hypothetical protein ACXKGW_29505, partial [Klebsiella pneumoniae subsp. pneumoniae]